MIEGGRESEQRDFKKASMRDGMLSMTVHDTHSGLQENEGSKLRKDQKEGLKVV